MPRYTVRYLVILLLTLVPLTPALAQNATDSERVTLALEDADIRDLIRWAADVVDKNIIVHPNVKGRVSVLAGEAMTRDEAYEVFLSVLQVHGFAVVESRDAIKVIPDAIAKENSVPVVDEASAVPAEDVVVRVIRVKNVSAGQLATILRPLVPSVGHLVAYPETNALIVSDRASNIERLVNIIERLDRVGLLDIEVLELQYASAKDVIEVLNTLMPNSSGGPQAQAVEGTGLTFAADERSNSILMSGDPVMRAQVKKIVEKLDRPLAGRGNTQVIFLNYAKAEDMVPILEGLSGTVKEAEKDETFVDAEVSIQASEANNALIVSAPPSVQDAIRNVVGQLDVRRPQVLVEALLVEVGQDVVRDLGVQWASTPSSNGVAGGVNALTQNLIVQPPETGNLTDIGALGAGISLGYFSAGDLIGLIRALESDASTNVLSTPTIVTMDNQEAEILVGENVPFVTGSELRDTGNPFTTIERQDIGVTLKVTPHVNDDNSLTLEIEQSVESLSASPAAQTADVVTNKRSIKTTVLVEHDQILVLGGLIRDEVQEKQTKVPLFGDIPILGAAFRGTSRQSVKRNLMVFLHPVILKDNATSRQITLRNYERVREAQEDFNDDTNWEMYRPGGGPYLPDYDSLKLDAGQLTIPVDQTLSGGGASTAPQPVDNGAAPAGASESAP